MTTGIVEVTIGRGGKATEYKKYKDGRLISTRYGRRGSGGRPEIPPPKEETKKQTKEEYEAEQARKLSERELKYRESIERQERQERQFRTWVGMGADYPLGWLPTAHIGRWGAITAYNIGSSVVGTIHRGGIDPKKQLKERPLETGEAVINVGAPIISRGISFLRTPRTFEMVGVATEKGVSGIGRAKSLVGTKGFGFKEYGTKGKIKTDTQTLTGSFGDVVTSVTEKGKGVISSKALQLRKDLLDVSGVKVSEIASVARSGITKRLTGARAGTIKTDDYLGIMGGTTEGVTFRGIFKTTKGKGRDVLDLGTKAKAKLKPEKALDITEQIIKDLTPKTRPTPLITTDPLARPLTTKPKTETSTPLGRIIAGKELPMGKLFIGRDKPKEAEALLDSTQVLEATKERTKAKVKARQKESDLLGDIVKDISVDRTGDRVGELLDTRQPLRQRPKMPTKSFFPSFPTYIQPSPFPFGDIGLPFFRPEGRGRKRVTSKRAKQPRSFTPSLTALAFDVRGERIKAGELTGLGLRKIPEKRKRRKDLFDLDIGL